MLGIRFKRRALQKLNIWGSVTLVVLGLALLLLTLRWVVPLTLGIDPDSELRIDDKMVARIYPQQADGAKATSQDIDSAAMASWVSAWGTLLGVFATSIGFGMLFLQLRREERSLETQTSWTMYEASLSVLNTFVEKPELRPYFYENKALPTDDNFRHQVLAAAEIVCDHLENIVNSGEDGAIDDETYFVWVKYMRLMGLRSTVLTRFLSDKNDKDISCPIKIGATMLLIGEGQRYGETFKSIVIDGTVPDSCREQWAKEHQQEIAKNNSNALVMYLK